MSTDRLAPKHRCKVHEISGKAGSKSREVLERVAKQVQPVMRKHSWDVPLLSELTARNGRLWGLNIGGGGGTCKEIKLRLHRQGSDAFIEYDFIVGTMLHELCHNVHGPHDAKFYALLDTITEELEDFMAKGITGTGEGFDAPSKGRLGAAGFGGHNPDVSQLRSKMVQAAEGRAKRNSLMPGGPRRLGGRQRALTPQQAAAEAAERRARDDVGCGCGAKASTNLTEADVTALEEGQALSGNAEKAESTSAPSRSKSHWRGAAGAAGPSMHLPGEHAQASESAAGQSSAPAEKPRPPAKCRRIGEAKAATSRPAADKWRCELCLQEAVVDLTGASDDDYVEELE